MYISFARSMDYGWCWDDMGFGLHLSHAFQCTYFGWILVAFCVPTMIEMQESIYNNIIVSMDGKSKKKNYNSTFGSWNEEKGSTDYV